VNQNKLVVTVDKERPQPKVIAQAARLIQEGAVLVVPTDTCYIFAVNAIDPVAIALVYTIKNRPFNQPIHIAVRDLAMANEYVELNEWAKLLASKFLPGPLTIVLPKKETIPDILVGGGTTLGIRIPANRVLLQLVSTAGLPATATSANLSRLPTPYTVAEVLEQLGQHSTKVKLALDQGPLPRIATSTIIDLSTSRPRVLREGPIPGAKLLKVLGIQEQLH